MLNPTHEFVGHKSYVIGLLFSEDNDFLVSSGMDSTIKLWSTDNWEMLKEVEAHQNSVNSIDLAPDGKTLVSGSSDMTVGLWDSHGLRLRRRLQDRKKVVSTVKFSPDGRWVAAGSYGGRVAIWTIEGEEVIAFAASKKNLSSIAFSPDQKLLATSGLGDEIQVWELPSGEHLSTLAGHKVAVPSLHFIREGSQLVSLGFDGKIIFWDATSWELIRVERATSEKTRALTLTPDEQVLVEVSEGKVLLKQRDSGDAIGQIPIGTKAIYGLAFSRDGIWMGVGAADGKIRIWNLPDLMANLAGQS